MADQRNSTMASEEYIRKIELYLAKGLGQAKYDRPVKRTEEKGIYDFGGEKVQLKMSDDEKTCMVSLNGEHYKSTQKFIADQSARFEKHGEPKMTNFNLSGKTDKQDDGIKLSWYELKKAEENELVTKGNWFVRGRMIRCGQNIIPLEASFWDVVFGISVTIVKSSVEATY